MISLPPTIGCIALAGLAAVACTPAARAETILHDFAGGSDGNGPEAGLIADHAGNLYGTTAAGGGIGCQGVGCGTVFKLAPNGSETIIYAFAGGSDGSDAASTLVLDSSGSLYGTTSFGGSADAGTLYKLAADGSETVLHAFQNGSDGAVPQGNLFMDRNGNLYGTTDYGGNTSCGGLGCGTVFRVTPGGKESVLYTFQGGSDGALPEGGVIGDRNGDLYGTALAGGTGCDPDGCGVVFKLAPDGTETILHAFQGGTDGMEPAAGVIADSAGNFYGTTTFGGGGGNGGCCGTVFRLAPNGSETVLYAFHGGSDAEVPYAGLVSDNKGNLYGTTYFGGGTKCGQTGRIGCGTVFKVAPDGSETVLLSFQGKRGTYPTASLLLKNKLLYGTTTAGGQFRDGEVFSLKK